MTQGNLLTFDWDAEVSDEERDRLFDKVLWAVRRWRLAVPAALFLETSAPLSFLAGQSLIVFSPFLAMLLPGGLSDVQRLSKILEKRENVYLLSQRIIETQEEQKGESDAARG